MGIFDLFNPSIEDMFLRGNVNGIISALKNKKDWRERSAAAKALLKIRDARSVEPLIQALKDDNNEVREAAAVVLGAVVILGAIEGTGIGNIYQAMAADRAQGVICFDSMQYTRAVATIIRALKDSNEHVRWGAARALGIIRDSEAVTPLTEALKDNNEQVRKEAALALEKIKHSSTKLKPNTPAVELQILVMKDMIDLNFDIK